MNQPTSRHLHNMAAQSKTQVNKQYVSNWYEVLHKLGENVTVVNMRKMEKQASKKKKK